MDYYGGGRSPAKRTQGDRRVHRLWCSTKPHPNTARCAARKIRPRVRVQMWEAHLGRLSDRLTGARLRPRYDQGFLRHQCDGAALVLHKGIS
jgi:hypothetical protein